MEFRMMLIITLYAEQKKKNTQVYNSVFLMSTAHFFPTDNGSIVQCIDIMKNIAICNFLKMERNL